MDGELGNQQVKSEQEGGILDRRYYRGLLAIPKGVEVICSLIAYICVELEACTGWATTYGYFKFISIAAMVTTLILWILLLFKVPQRILRCDCVRWPFPELCYYAGVIILYFFGDLLLAIQQCGGGHEAGAAFGFFALFAYIADAVWTGRTWWYVRKELRAGTQQQQQQEVTSPVEGRY